MLPFLRNTFAPISTAQHTVHVRSSRGFTLVEMAIVFVIMGLMLGGGIYAVNSINASNKRTESLLKQERITKALATHVALYKRLPCPADTTDGQERTTCAGANGVGFVPWAQLNLNQNDSFDGWGNALTYAVSTNATGNADADLTAQNAMACSTLATANADLQVRDRANTYPTAQQAQAAYVIISHGENGRGATNRQGRRNGLAFTGAQASEQQNTPAGNSPFIFYEESAQNDPAFDDLLLYKSAPQVLQQAGCKRDTAYDTGAGTRTPVTDTPPGGAVSMRDPDLDQLFYYHGSAPENKAGVKIIKNKDHNGDGNKDENRIEFGSQNTPGSTSHPIQQRACYWYKYDLPLKDRIVKTYFEAAFNTDITGSDVQGLVEAFVSSKTKITNNIPCGGRGEFLGYGDDGAYKISDDPKIGVEIDTNHSAAQGDPANNHIAILGKYVNHTNPTESPNCTNGTGLQTILQNSTYQGLNMVRGPACIYRQGNTTAAVDFLENGITENTFHQFRVELHRYGSNGCPSNRVRIKVWFWPSSQRCTNACNDLKKAFTAESPALDYCMLPSATDSDLLEKIRFGLTTGVSRTYPVVQVRGFGATATPYAVHNPSTSPVDSATLSVTPQLAMDNPDPKYGLWTSASTQYTTTTWMDFSSIAGVQLESKIGEIVWDWRSTGGQKYNGFGIRSYNNTDELDQHDDAAENAESLKFTFSRTWRRLGIGITRPGTPNDQVLITAYRAGNAIGRKRLRACGNSNARLGYENLDFGTAFDAITIAPDTRDGSGASSKFYISEVYTCGSNTANCTPPQGDTLCPASTITTLP